METKICNECKQEKPVSDFRVYDKIYLSNKCKKCIGKPIYLERVGVDIIQTCKTCGF